MKRKTGLKTGVDLCGATRKRRFGTQAGADSFVQDLGRRVNALDGLRSYFCLYCGGWHLTSKPLRPRSHRGRWSKGMAQSSPSFST